MSGLAEIEARRASRAQSLLENLASTLEAEHPAMIRRKDQFELRRASVLGLRTQAERLKRRPTIGEGQSLVYGCVLDSADRPATGVHMTLLRGEDQVPVGETVSDKYGDFAIVMCTAPSGAVTTSPSAWRLRATADDGTLLFSSDQPFDLAPGASVYVEVRLTGEDSDD
ncbi:hypothetical protein [Thiohalocapsa halophila]|nr:hypothetical protein [Thiohalocapsa halophila]